MVFPLTGYQTIAAGVISIGLAKLVYSNWREEQRIISIKLNRDNKMNEKSRKRLADLRELSAIKSQQLLNERLIKEAAYRRVIWLDDRDKKYKETAQKQYLQKMAELRVSTARREAVTLALNRLPSRELFENAKVRWHNIINQQQTAAPISVSIVTPRLPAPVEAPRLPVTVNAPWNPPQRMTLNKAIHHNALVLASSVDIKYAAAGRAIFGDQEYHIQNPPLVATSPNVFLHDGRAWPLNVKLTVREHMESGTFNVVGAEPNTRDYINGQIANVQAFREGEADVIKTHYQVNHPDFYNNYVRTRAQQYAEMNVMLNTAINTLPEQ